MRLFMLLFTLTLIAGCGPNYVAEAEKELEAAGGGDGDAASVPSQPAAPVEYELVKAVAGVGKQGRGYGGGIISEPVRQRFIQEQKIIYEIAIPQYLVLYDVEHGHPPKTHEEFMEKIIEANGVTLPELPEGETYVYVPEQKQLMVRRPKPPGSGESSDADANGEPADNDDPLPAPSIPGVPTLPKLPTLPLDGQR